MEEISIDYTLFFSQLESLEEGSDIVEHFKNSFYQNLNKEQETLVIEFVENYRQRLSYNQISKKKAEKSCKSQSEICLEKLFAVTIALQKWKKAKQNFLTNFGTLYKILRRNL